MYMPDGGYSPPPRRRTAVIISTIAGFTVLLVAIAVALLVTRTPDTPAAATSGSSAVFTEPAGQRTETITTQPPSLADFPTETTSTERPSSQPNPADLGLSTPISVPPCDNSVVVIVANSTDPSSYRSEMAAALAQQSRTGDNIQYMQAAQVGCTSLRTQVDGNQIYTAYVLASSPGEACRILAKYPGQYAKRLSNQAGPNDWLSC